VNVTAPFVGTTLDRYYTQAVTSMSPVFVPLEASNGVALRNSDLVRDLTGPQGPQGPAGPVGAAGAQRPSVRKDRKGHGPQGPTGPAGPSDAYRAGGELRHFSKTDRPSLVSGVDEFTTFCYLRAGQAGQLLDANSVSTTQRVGHVPGALQGRRRHGRGIGRLDALMRERQRQDGCGTLIGLWLASIPRQSSSSSWY
jgi:hypothetical protein